MSLAERKAKGWPLISDCGNCRKSSHRYVDPRRHNLAFIVRRPSSRVSLCQPGDVFRSGSHTTLSVHSAYAGHLPFGVINYQHAPTSTSHAPSSRRSWRLCPPPANLNSVTDPPRSHHLACIASYTSRGSFTGCRSQRIMLVYASA